MCIYFKNRRLFNVFDAEKITRKKRYSELSSRMPWHKGGRHGEHSSPSATDVRMCYSANVLFFKRVNESESVLPITTLLELKR